LTSSIFVDQTIKPSDQVLAKDTDQIGPGTELQVQVKEPAVTHSASMLQLRRWIEGIAVSPDELLRKNRVKALLEL
jgi:hypothetical protein